MRITHVLRDHVSWFTLDFLLLSNHFDSTSTTKGVGFHNVHMLIAVSLTFSRKLAEVIWEKVSAGNEVVFLGEEALQTGCIFPH